MRPLERVLNLTATYLAFASVGLLLTGSSGLSCLLLGVLALTATVASGHLALARVMGRCDSCR